MNADADRTISVRTLRIDDFERWNGYVSRSAAGSIFHCAQWQTVFTEALGHNTIYLLAECAGEIVGVLPVVEIRSRLFDHCLISVPFLSYGGTLSSSIDAADALEAYICTKAEALGVDFVEFRDREKMRDNWVEKSMYVTFRKEIPDTPDECLKMIPRKQRAMIRKGIANELTGRIDSSIDTFYDILSESYRNLGTPVLPRRYFESIKAQLGDDCEILTIEKDGTAVASVMSYYYKDEVIPYYGGSRSIARNLKANDFMYWDLMRRACERGVRIFDYGRSRQGTGSYRFKRHWGFEPEPLHFQYKLVRQTELPNVSPSNPKYELAISLWRKLPVWLTKIIGPPVARVLPG